MKPRTLPGHLARLNLLFVLLLPTATAQAQADGHDAPAVGDPSMDPSPEQVCPPLDDSATEDAATDELVAQLDQRRLCLRDLRVQRFRAYDEARDGYLPRRLRQRRLARAGDVPADIDAEYQARTATSRARLAAVRAAVRAHHLARQAHDHVARRLHPWRLSVGYDAAAWRWLPVRGTGGASASTSANYRQPGAYLGLAYEAPVTLHVALRVGARIGLGQARLGLSAPGDDSLRSVFAASGPAYALQLDGGVRFYGPRLFSLGLSAQLRIGFPPDRSVEVLGENLRFRDRPLVGLVFGFPLQVTLGAGSRWRVEAEPGVGVALGSTSGSAILSMSAGLSAAF